MYEQHKAYIRQDGIRQKPVLVVFSAVPGSGKSTLTRLLVEDYGFLRIANKDVRLAAKQVSAQDAESGTDNVVGPYTLWLLDKLTQQSRPSIVLDRNIDQWYEAPKKWAEEHGYRLVVVRMQVSLDILKRRIATRRPEDRDHTLSVLEFYRRKHETVSFGAKMDLELVDDFDLPESAATIAALLN